MKTSVGFMPGKGRAIMADEDIPAGATIETAPVVTFPKEQWKHIAKTQLGEYCYFWGDDLKSGAMALGMGSLYNHSFAPNARYLRHVQEDTIEYVALVPISVGEEITINYNGDPDDLTPVWFDVK
jgi:SET domain-containing protein